MVTPVLKSLLSYALLGSYQVWKPWGQQRTKYSHDEAPRWQITKISHSYRRNGAEVGGGEKKKKSISGSGAADWNNFYPLYRVTTQLFLEPPPRAVVRTVIKIYVVCLLSPSLWRPTEEVMFMVGWLVNPIALWSLLLRPLVWFSRWEAAGHGCPIWGTGCLKARVGEDFRPNSSGGFAYRKQRHHSRTPPPSSE